jgi:hypothetical protein
MDLIDAAGYFDDTAVTAPGSSETLFMAFLDVYTNQQRDGLQVQRRTLAYDPTQVFTLPADGIVAFAGRNWALGLASPDDFAGGPLRSAYIAHLLDSVIQIGTAGDWLANTPRATTHGGTVWMKSSKNSDGTEEVWSEVDVYSGSGVQAEEGEFALLQGQLYRIRNSYFTVSGIRALDCIELPKDVRKTVTWTTQGGYDKIKQQPVPGASVDIPALVMRFYHDYRRVTQAAIKPGDGDLVARVAQTYGVTAGDAVAVDGVTYRVVSRRAMPDATWWLHLTV